MTKKSVLASSVFISLGMYLFGAFSVSHKICGGAQYTSCVTNIDNLSLVFLPFLSLAIVSLPIYFLSQDVFRAWIKFVYWWVPLSMGAIVISPQIGNSFFPIEKVTVGGGLSLVFIFISVIIIIKHLLFKKQ